jgi:hypothetical protein
MRPKKRFAYKEPSSSLSEGTIDQEDFKVSTSLFGGLEEEALNMCWSDMESFDEVLNYQAYPEEYTHIAKETEVPEPMRHLYMEKLSADDIRIFRPSKHPGISKICSSLFSKLRFVLLNNDQSRQVPREEGHIDDLILDLLKTMEFDDGENMMVKCCYLDLVIAGKSFSANADREGRRGMEILWIMQESKHVNDSRFKDGDVQLVSCMLAACQFNHTQFLKIYPRRMFGIKMKGDQMYFYCMIVTEDYMRALRRGLPLTEKEEIYIAKYPSERGLRLSNPEERKQAIRYLWSLRCYAMNIELIDT